MKSRDYKYNQKTALFLSRTPINYRISVMKVFKEFAKSSNPHPMAKPERILQEFAVMSGRNINEVILEYEDKLSNLRRNGEAVLKQEDFFGLIEKFVWKYCEDHISGLNIGDSIHSLGISFYHLFSSPKNYRYSDQDGDFEVSVAGEEVIKSVLECDCVYKVDFSGAKLSKAFIDELLDGNLDQPFETKKLETYFYIKKLPYYEYDLVISFNNSDEENICYGIHSVQTGSFFLNQICINQMALCRYEQKHNGSDIEFLVYPFISRGGIHDSFSFDNNYRELAYDTSLVKVNDKVELTHSTKRLKKILKFMDLDFSLARVK